MAALTKAGLVKRVRTLLGDDPWFDTCVEPMDTTETGLDVTDGTKYSIGVVIEFQDDGELCLVTGISSNTLTVIRNYQFSVTNTAGTGTSHSNNAVIAADPAYRYADINQHLEGVVGVLWPHVWRTPTVTAAGPSVSITPVAGTHWYDLAASDSAALANFELGVVSQLNVAGTKIITYGLEPRPIALRHGTPTGLNLDGDVGIYFVSIDNTTNNIEAKLIKPLDTTQTVAGTYDFFDDNTPAADCLMYYIAQRLVESKEISRVTLEDVGMGDASVQPGSRLRLAAYLKRRGDEARHEWEVYCRKVWPKLPHSRFYKDDIRIGGKF